MPMLHFLPQLFGETDPDEEVSPDSEDPEANEEKSDEPAEVRNHFENISDLKLSSSWRKSGLPYYVLELGYKLYGARFR